MREAWKPHLLTSPENVGCLAVIFTLLLLPLCVFLTNWENVCNEGILTSLTYSWSMTRCIEARC